jgi:hypothetical protein
MRREDDSKPEMSRCVGCGDDAGDVWFTVPAPVPGGGFGVCKAGALPAELHARCNYMILIGSLIEFREIDYLLCLQVLSQADLPTHHGQPLSYKILTADSSNSCKIDSRVHSVQERPFCEVKVARRKS